MKLLVILLIFMLCSPVYGMQVGKNLTFRKPLDDQAAELDFLLNKMILNLTGRISFADGEIADGEDGENLDIQFQVVTDSGTANAEFTVAHTLGRVPVGYSVVKINKGGIVYDSGTTWTASNIYLKCSSANTAVTLFIY